MFDDSKIYMADDPALRAIAPRSTMAHWRCESRGPAYVKLGKRVGYRGVDLNKWIDECRIEPKAA